MALSDLAITYDIQPPVYFPGKPISGKVSFTVAEPVPFDHVRVECYGIAGTKRTKTAISSSGFPKNITYSACEICCEQGKTLLDGSRSSGTSPENGILSKGRGAEEGQEVDQLEFERPVVARKTSTLKPASRSVIKSGSYSFPFTFFLPLKCPSSFEGSYGQIRYFCKVLVTCSGSVQFSSKEAFTVIGWTDLNAYPTASLHYQTEANATTDEKGGKILARLYLRQQGFVPGEMVNARMEVANNSAKPVSAIFAQFVQRVGYAAKRENADDWSKWEERKVLQQATRKEKVASSKSSLLKWEVFTVPPCCPTMIIDTNILRVQYEILFHFVFDSNAPGLVLAAPIVIGAMPLKHSFDELRAVRLRQADANIHSGSYLPMMERYADIPIPAYKPQSMEPVDIRDPSDMAFMPDSIKFVPMAVVYDAKPTETADDSKRSSRRVGNDEKRGTRSRSTLSRFSFRGSTDSLAAAPKENAEESPKEKKKQEKEERKQEKEEKKRQQEEKKRQQQEEKEANKAKSGSTFRRWGKKKNTISEPVVSTLPNPESEGKPQEGATDMKPGFQHKGTQEPPVENGTLTDADNTSGGEEFL